MKKHNWTVQAGSFFMRFFGFKNKERTYIITVFEVSDMFFEKNSVSKIDQAIFSYCYARFLVVSAKS